MTPPSVMAAPPAGTANWKDHGACVGEDPVIFFPHEKAPAYEAKQICATCTVRDDCLEYALGLNIQHGIWGGLSIHERRKIRAARYRAGQASVPAAAARVAGAVPCVARDIAAQPAPTSTANSRATQHPQ